MRNSRAQVSSGSCFGGLNKTKNGRFQGRVHGPPQHGRGTKRARLQAHDSKFAPFQLRFYFLQQARMAAHFSPEQNQTRIQDKSQVQDDVRQDRRSLQEDLFGRGISRSRQI